MRKIFTSIITMALVLLLCGSALAVESPLGLSEAEKETLIKQGYTNYEKSPGTLNNFFDKPKTQFTVRAGDQEESSPIAGIDTPTPSLVVTGDTAVDIFERSTPTYPGRVITQYDFQYRIVPAGQDREAQPIVANFLSSWPAVQKQFSQAMNETKALGTNAELELYLCVSDGASKNDKLNWSSNGNVAVGKIDDRFPKGIIWYFSGMVIQYKTGGPDFYPTPEGTNQWQESFIDPQVCAKTYYYTADQTSITFPVTVANTGKEAAETDLKAVWYGASSVDANAWDNPVWQADENFILDVGKSKTFNVTVDLSTIPEYSNGLLVFKCNVDGKTPALEENQANNIMYIKIVPEGVDIEAELTRGPITYWIEPGETANILVCLMAIRNDSGTTPVNVDVTYTGPFGTVTQKDTLEGFYVGENTAFYDIRFSLNRAGTYKINASAWPVGQTDLNPSNNVDETTVVVKVKDTTPAHKVDPADQTRVNLRS